MAGKKGMHTRVLNPAAVERIRERIQADRIIKKLEDHILDGAEMTATQVSASLGLLKKRVPDLAAVELTGPAEDGAHVFKVVGDWQHSAAAKR